MNLFRHNDENVDEKSITKRVMQDILGSPMVIFPFMVGSAAFASLFALGLKGSAAVGAMLVGVGGCSARPGCFLPN